MSSTNLSSDDVISMSKKMTTLEMKELNERQRAEHAARMYDQQKVQLRHLEDRNMELEGKFAEVGLVFLTMWNFPQCITCTLIVWLSNKKGRIVICV